MKNPKKLVAVLLAFALIFSLAAPMAANAKFGLCCICCGPFECCCAFGISPTCECVNGVAVCSSGAAAVVSEQEYQEYVESTSCEQAVGGG